MIQLFLLVMLQLFVIGVVVLVLRHLFNLELQKVAVEKFQSLSANQLIETINIYHASPLSENIEKEITVIGKNKFPNGKIVFQQDPIIKGGLVIVMGDEMLDFSLANRIKQFRS